MTDLSNPNRPILTKCRCGKTPIITYNQDAPKEACWMIYCPSMLNKIQSNKPCTAIIASNSFNLAVIFWEQESKRWLVNELY